MLLSGYNWRLGYVVAAATLWLTAGMLLALGAVHRGEPAPLRLSFGPPPGGLWLPGELRAAEERDGQLVLTLALPPQAPREIRGEQGLPLSELPQDLAVQFVDPGPRGERPAALELRLKDASAAPLMLPGGRALVLAERYVIKYGRGGVRLLPRTPQLTRERIQRWLKREERQPPPGKHPGLKHWRERRGEGPPPQAPPDGKHKPPPDARPPAPPHPDDGRTPPPPPGPGRRGGN